MVTNQHLSQHSSILNPSAELVHKKSSTNQIH